MKLREWLYINRIKIKDFAEEMKLTKSTVFTWMNGKKSPSKRNLARVVEYTDGRVKKPKDLKDEKHE